MALQFPLTFPLNFDQDSSPPMIQNGPPMLDNGIIKMGVIPQWGAVIGHFAKSGSSRNVFPANRFDDGVINQSYWGDPGGAGMSWPWDPIQGGSFCDYYYGFSSVTDYLSNGVDKSYARILPVQFDFTEGSADPNMVMEQWITLKGNIAEVKFRATYTGGDRSRTYENDPPGIGSYLTEYAQWYGKVGWNQETPAISIGTEYNNRYAYTGAAPAWTGAPVTNLGHAPAPYSEGAFIIPSEKWAAAVADDGWGFGVYAPESDAFSFINIGTTYITPSTQFNFTDGSTTPVVFEYTVYMTLGTVEEIRSNFYALEGLSYENTASKTISGKASIVLTAGDVTKVQTAKARINKVSAKTQTGRSSLKVKSTRIQTGKASLIPIFTKQKIQNGVSRILNVLNKTQTAKAKIIQGFQSKTQTGKSRILGLQPYLKIYHDGSATNGTWVTPTTYSGVTFLKNNINSPTKAETLCSSGIGSDQYVQAKIGGIIGISLILRSDVLFGAPQYRLEIQNTQLLLIRRYYDTWTNISREEVFKVYAIGGSVSIDDVIRFEAIGFNPVTLKVYRNGNLILTTIDNIVSNNYGYEQIASGYPGIGFNTYAQIGQPVVNYIEVGNISPIKPITQYGKAKIGTPPKPFIQTGKSRIKTILYSTQNGKSSIEINATRTLKGKASIKNIIAALQNGIATIIGPGRDITQKGISSISATRHYSQQGRGKIYTVNNISQSGVASIGALMPSFEIAGMPSVVEITKNITDLNPVRILGKYGLIIIEKTDDPKGAIRIMTSKGIKSLKQK